MPFEDALPLTSLENEKQFLLRQAALMII